MHRFPSRSRLITAAGAWLLLTHTSVFGASTSQVHVTIAVDGPAPARTYVAAVPYERPLGAPLEEQVISGHAVVFTLPEGRYRFVAAAPDYGVEKSDFIYLAPSSSEDVNLSLKYLSSISGRVIDAAGNPITEAAVGLPGAFRIDYVDKLSATAEALLRPTSVVKTDSTGVFVLPVHSLGTSFIFVEAPGYAPAMLAQVRAANSTVGDIRLQRGARLEAQVPLSSYDRIQLLPRAVTLPEALSLSGAVALWSRAVGGSVRWDSLPAGQYDVCFAVSAARPQQVPPRCVSTVDLVAGAKQTLVLAPPRGAAAKHAKTLGLTFPQSRSNVLVRLRGPAGASLPRQATLDAGNCTGSAPLSVSIPFAVDEHGLAAVPVPSGCSDLHVAAGLLFSDRLPNRNSAANGVSQPINVTLRIGSSLATRVRDPRGQPVRAHAELLLASDMTVASSADTDDAGWIWLPGVPDGMYVLRITAPGAEEPYQSETFSVRPQEQFYLPDIVLPKPVVKQHRARP